MDPAAPQLELLRMKPYIYICQNLLIELKERQLLTQGRYQLSIYDLRHLPMSEAQTHSKAYISFPKYRSDPVVRGFDIAPDLIAAGTPDSCVSIFNSNTGEEVMSRKPTVPQDVPEGCAEIKTLSFLEDVGKRNSPALLIGCGSYLEAWT